MRGLVGTVALVVGLGCQAERSSTTWEARREVLGDTTTVRTISGQAWSSVPELVEDLSIGVLDGPPEFMFGEVTRLADDLRGGVYVLDDQAVEIRHFDRRGELIRVVGQEGEGPGEYKRLTLGMVVDSGGVLHMHDWGNGRIARFDDEGNPLAAWPLPSSFLTTSRGTWLYSEGPGRLLVAARVEGDPALIRVEEGRLTDTLAVPRLPGMPEHRGGPYRVDTYWRWHPDGYFVVGVSDDYSLDLRRVNGVLRIRRDVGGVPVDSEEAGAWRRHFEWMEQQPSYSPPEGEWMPSTMPPFRDIEVSSDGRIWVQRNVRPAVLDLDEDPSVTPPIGGGQTFVYDVFEADGIFLGQIRFPDRVEPHVFGAGYVWGVRRGEFDEEYVVRLSLTVPDGS